MSSVNSMTQYLTYFNITSTSAGASKTGIVFVGQYRGAKADRPGYLYRRPSLLVLPSLLPPRSDRSTAQYVCRQLGLDVSRRA